ncbi:MAG TPA: ankyrin repeat domain-containing protein [Saprospiraceae bacterium]|nr:ankyrin repeat domain-containing protein [Saprospiraceae bacterium]
MTKRKYLLLSVTFLLFTLSFCTQINNSKIVEYVDDNDYNKVEKWLKNGGNPNIILPDNSTLLYIATGPHGGIEVTKILIEAGADVNKGHFDYTPLMNAASWTNYLMVEYLLDHKANPNLKNISGKTALQVIGYCNNCPSEVKTRSLLEKVTLK